MSADSNSAAANHAMPLQSRRSKGKRRADAKVRSPDELRELQRTTNQTVRRATMAMIMSMLILLVFNSDGLRSYARDLPESYLADRIVLAADWWHNAMRHLGTTKPKALVRDLVQRLREA